MNETDELRKNKPTLTMFETCFIDPVSASTLICVFFKVRDKWGGAGSIQQQHKVTLTFSCTKLHK